MANSLSLPCSSGSLLVPSLRGIRSLGESSCASLGGPDRLAWGLGFDTVMRGGQWRARANLGPGTAGSNAAVASYPDVKSSSSARIETGARGEGLGIDTVMGYSSDADVATEVSPTPSPPTSNSSLDLEISRRIVDVIGKTRSPDSFLERVGEEWNEEWSTPDSLDWKTDDRLKRSCEAGTGLRVAVLLSGGVDSSVALRLLCNAGHSCTAFYLKIWFQDDFENLWSSCPWEEDLSFAQDVCDEAGVELKVVHLTDAYWANVVSESISEIQAGRTPNPDMLCNSKIKFGKPSKMLEHPPSGPRIKPGLCTRSKLSTPKCGSILFKSERQQLRLSKVKSEFLKHLEGEQFDRVASGHYARIKKVVNDTGVQITRLYLSADEAKDQTYFLSQLSQNQLSQLIFPLGELTKAEVREVAKAMSLANKHRRDSQGICFLGKVKFREFIARHLGEREGCLLEAETGNLLGFHKGFWFYTVGQRQGIGLSNGPWFVVAKDVDHNVVFVSRKYFSEKKRRSFKVGSFNWMSGSPLSALENMRCKVRHGPHFYDCIMDFETPCDLKKTSRVSPTESGDEEPSIAVVKLDRDDQGLAPGQYAAFYKGDECLGSGIIFEALGEDVAMNVSVQALEAAKVCSSSNPEVLKDLKQVVRNRRPGMDIRTPEEEHKNALEEGDSANANSKDAKSKSLGISLSGEERNNMSPYQAAGMRTSPLGLVARLFSWLQKQVM